MEELKDMNQIIFLIFCIQLQTFKIFLKLDSKETTFSFTVNIFFSKEIIAWREAQIDYTASWVAITFSI